MSVFNVLNAAVYSRLTGAAGLTALLAGTASVYFNQAPPEADFDYVVFSYQAGGDENKSPHRAKNIVMFVRGHSRTGPARAGSIDAQIDTALHLKPLTVTGYTNFWLARETDMALTELDEAGVATHMAGAMYRVRLAQ